jgi:hypothetical protein
LPTIFDASRVDRIIDIPQIEAEKTMRRLARVKKALVQEHHRVVRFGHRSKLQKNSLML